MLKTKKLLISILFLVLILIQFSTICLAASTPVTDENLNSALQKFVSSNENEEGYKVSVSNNVITITVDNESYTLNYDLTEKPTFSLEVPIQKGMSYEDFKKKTDNLILPMLGYIAVANIQGVEIEDASAYFLFSYLGSALNGSFSTENSYIIIDDLNLSEGVTIEKNDDPKTIYTSEFGERVMEYVNNMYKEKQSISDSTGINSYTLDIEKLETTETSCKIVSKLSVNLDADFSKIIGYTDQVADSIMNKDITKENADYTLTLKVGQKCKIESTEKIISHELYSSSCIELAEDYSEITAIKAGNTNGYLYVGEEKKSIYITVEENTGNATLETLTLKIGTVSNTNSPNETVEEEKENIKEDEKNNNTTNEDNTISASKLPQAGLNNSILLVIIAFIISILIIGFKLKEYSDIK